MVTTQNAAEKTISDSPSLCFDYTCYIVCLLKLAKFRILHGQVLEACSHLQKQLQRSGSSIKTRLSNPHDFKLNENPTLANVWFHMGSSANEQTASLGQRY